MDNTNNFIILKDYVIDKSGIVRLKNKDMKICGPVMPIKNPASETINNSEGCNLQNVENENHELPTSEAAPFTWNHNNTLLFLEEYQKRLDKFRNPKIKKKSIWQEISSEMGKRGYIIDADSLDRKMRNMKGTYAKILDNNKKSTTGTGRINWEFFNRFEEIFSDDHHLKPKHVVASMTATRNEIQNSPSSSSEQNTPTTAGENGRWKRLDVFRKRQLEIESEKLSEIKNIRLQLEESNHIQRAKLELFQQYLQSQNK